MLSKTYKINYNQTSGNEDEFNLYFYFIKSININYIEIYTLNINEKQYKYELNKKEKSIFYKLFKISIDFLHKDVVLAQGVLAVVGCLWVYPVLMNKALWGFIGESTEVVAVSQSH